MNGLVVEAIAVAVLERPAYLSIADFVADPDMMALARAVAERNELPLDRLRFLADEPDRDVASVALDELGPPVDKQPVLLVRGGADPDPFVTTLARMVAGRPWVDEELGLTHLDELGGTAVLEFLDWFMPDSGATVLIVDQRPVIAVEQTPQAQLPAPAAVALRVGRGAGLIRVVSWGAGAPPPAMAYRFTGQGPCDPWIDLHTALAGGWLAAGDEALLHATGVGREGWALIEVTGAATGHGRPE
jgi:hypothetical protein